jgi:hypothetical protein
VHDPGKVRGKLVEPGILRVEVDTVPVYWAEGGQPVRAALAFRVGRADELLASAGITRLVGHLAVKAAGGGGEFAVGPTISCFRSAGTQHQVMRFLRSVTAALAGLPSNDEVVKARREMPSGPPGLAELALGLRWGGRGPGLARHEEYGLTWVGPDEVTAWQSRWFTAGNAVAWVTGPRLDDLELTLPDGDRQPVAAMPPARTLTPAMIHVATDRAAVSLVHPSSPEFSAALTGMGAQCQTLNGELVHAVLTAPTAADLVRLVDGWQVSRPVTTPATWTEPPEPADLERWCEGELLGVRVASRAERAMAQAWTTEDAVAGALATALDGALYLLAPDDQLPTGRAAGGATWTTPPAEGVAHPPATPDRAHPDKRLIVEPTAITLVLDDRRAVRISLAGATSLRFADGGRGLWSTDGMYLDVHPADWERGDAAIAAIDRAIPAARTVPLVSVRPRA